MNCSSEFCHITPACRLKQALSKAVQSFLTELDNYTLADLVEENQPLYKIIAGGVTKIFIRDDNGGTEMSQDPFQEREAENNANPIPSREFILEHLTKREKPASVMSWR